MNNRLKYNKKTYTSKLNDEIINISELFTGHSYWQNKKHEGVLVAYDFIPQNDNLKILELNTHIGIYKEYIPYFNFDTLVDFFVQNKYNKVIALVSKMYDIPVKDKENPSTDFMSILEDKLKTFNIGLEVTQDNSTINFDNDTFLLRFSFDPESKIDGFAANKKSFLTFLKENELSRLTIDNTVFLNDIFPNYVIKNSTIDRTMGLEFTDTYKSELNKNQYLENFIVSDQFDEFENYNIELRGLSLITPTTAIPLNTEPFVSAKFYEKISETEYQQYDTYGNSFLKDTDILLSDGSTKKIQNILPGDKLLSYDIKSLQKNKVWKKWVSDQINLSTVKQLESTARGVVGKMTYGYVVINGNRFTKSANLCVLHKNSWKFKPASEIEVGDVILKNNYEIEEIRDVEVVNEAAKTYGIDVNNYDNYFGNNYFVHNVSLGAWCFIAGTKVTMHDGEEKNIEDVVVGDVVKSWNEKTEKIEESTVKSLIQPLHDDIVRISFSDNTSVTNTFDHPHYVKNVGWCSFKPHLTLSRYDMPVDKLKIGDTIFKLNGDDLVEETITEINVISPKVEKSINEKTGELEVKKEEFQTYIFSLDKNFTFFANGVLTHNKSGGAYIWAMGGRSSAQSNGSRTNTIQYFDGDNGATNATDASDLAQSIAFTTGVCGASYKFTLGGYNGGNTNAIQYSTATTVSGNASDGGDLTVSRRASMSGQGATYGFCFCGSPPTNVIDYINMGSTTGNASDAGDYPWALRDPAGMGNSRDSGYSFGAGGRASSGHEVNYITHCNVSSAGSAAASDRGDLTTGRYANGDGGGGGTTYIFHAGGFKASASETQNVTDYISDSTSTANASDKGDLTVGRYYLSGGSGDNGYTHFMGGYNNNTVSNYNIIEYTNNTTTSGNGSDKGDLIGNRSGHGVSESETGYN